MRQLVLCVVRLLGRIVIGLMTGKALHGSAGVLPVGMALRATHARVRTDQREVREIMVEVRRLPGRGRMAGQTFVRIVSCRVIRILRRRIVRFVARVALHRRLRIRSVRVTLQTGHRLMGPG